MARVWITDGSVPVFSDTRRLRASHRGPFGLPVRYEGFVDPDVPRGSVELAGAGDDVLFVEAEWYLEPVDGVEPFLRDPDSFTESTPVVLQGLIEGKWMNRLLGTKAWRPASISNNVIAAGDGITTSLGAVEGGISSGGIRIDHETASGATNTYESTLADLRGHNLVELVRDVVRACAEDGEPLDGIDLGALGERAATVNERDRMKAAMRPIPNPLNMRPHNAKERLVRRAIADNIGLPPGREARLTTTNGQDVDVGNASLRWRSA